MRCEWLRKSENSQEIIVVFGGWAVGPACFSHLTSEQDILFLSDYKDLTTDLPDLSTYTARSLVAWSFGVAAYGHWRIGRRQTFDRHVAINGSLTPVNLRTGIPPRIFRQTVENVSEQTFQDFLALCFGAPQPVQSFNTALRLSELLAVHHRGDAPDCDWDRIWISAQDRIFPPQNLERAWVGAADRIRRLDAPHVPFAAWTTWKDLLA